MIHPFLAAFFVTMSLVVLAIEYVRNSKCRLSFLYLFLYLLGTAVWGVAAINTESVGLIIISAIQFSCCLLLICFRKDESNIV